MRPPTREAGPEGPAPQSIGSPTDSSNASGTCEACEFAKLFGWWGPNHKGGTHCAQCHRSWRGTAQAHCPASCHQQFSNNRSADLHDRGGHCIPPSDVKFECGAPQLKAVETRDGLVWVRNLHSAVCLDSLRCDLPHQVTVLPAATPSSRTRSHRALDRPNRVASGVDSRARRRVATVWSR
jgi:hypothetical protein